jgi:hypothetical protein
MTIDQARKALEGTSRGIERFGLTPPFRTIGKYLRKRYVSNVKKAVDPYGIKWAKKYKQPMEKIGHKDPVWMMTKEGKTFKQKIRSKEGKKARRRYRKEYGPPLTALKPIHRFGKFQTERNVANFLNTPGKALRFSKWKFDYGFTPGTSWVERLQFGGTFKGKPIPKRVILELTTNDREFIRDTLIKFVDLKLAKLGR